MSDGPRRIQVRGDFDREPKLRPRSETERQLRTIVSTEIELLWKKTREVKAPGDHLAACKLNAQEVEMLRKYMDMLRDLPEEDEAGLDDLTDEQLLGRIKR